MSPLPQNGNYYIVNLGYWRVWDSLGYESKPGTPIIGCMLNSEPTTNQQWKLTVQNPSANQVQLQTLVADHKGGFASTDGISVLTSNAPTLWTLESVKGSSETFRIRPANQYKYLVVTLLNGTVRDDVYKAHLTVEAVNEGAWNQLWQFVPVSKMSEFAAEHDLPIPV